MKPKLIFLSKLSLVVFIFLTSALAVNGQPILSTDSADYHPGSTVVVAGSGFLPGETVVLRVTHISGGNNETSTAHAPWFVFADQSGNIAAKWFVPTEEDELGASLLLTADGKTSSLHAESFFTDAIVTVTTSNVSWKSLPITLSDAVVIKSGGSLIVDVTDAQCASIKIAGASSDGTMGSAGKGNLIFNAGSQLTVNGIVTLGASEGSNNYVGTVDMTNGGKLVCNGFAKLGFAAQVLKAGSGSIELNSTNTLLADFRKFNNLAIKAGTTSLKYADTVNVLTVLSGAVLDLSCLNIIVNSLSGSGVITNNSATGTADNMITVGGDNSNSTFTGIISDGIVGRKLLVWKKGTGVLTLTGANSYSGITSLVGGSIAIGNNSALGSGPMNFGPQNSTSIFASGGPRILNNEVWISSDAPQKATIGGTNDLVILGKVINRTGNRILSISNTGKTTFSGPIVLSDYCPTSRTLTFTGAGNIVIDGTIINCEGTGVSQNVTFDNGFTGSAVINGHNTYTGTTVMGGGTFDFGNNTVFGKDAVYLGNAFVSARTNFTGLNSIANTIRQIGHTTFTGGNSIEFSGAWTNHGSFALTNNIANGVLSITNTVDLSYNYNSYSFTLDGAGTTSITGLIANGVSTASNVVYSGTGTLILGNSANRYTGTTTVNSGELRINPNATSATFASKVVLGGGRLTTTNIASNVSWASTSTLAVSSNSIIDLGSNSHILKFADSHGAAWSASTLTINGWTGPGGSAGTGGRIFFGSDATALTATQLAKIKFTGYSGGAMLLSTGELVPTAQCNAPIFATSPSGQPANQLVTYGENAIFSVAASGSETLTYNWRVSKDAGVSFTDITGESFAGYAGATSSSLTVTKPTVAMSNYEYRCVVTNSCGTATTNPGVLMVNLKVLNVSISASDKEYDGNTNAEVTAVDPITGVVAGDVINAVVSRGSFDTKSAGISKKVTANISLEGADANNYLVNSTASATANITPKPVTVYITGSSRSYDGTRNADIQIQNGFDGVIDGDDVTAVAANAQFDSKDAGLSKVVTAEISLSGADALNYKMAGQASTNADITPLQISGTFTADDKIYDGNLTASVLTRSIDGVIGDDDVYLVGGTAVFVDRMAGDSKSVTLTGATLAGLALGNYSLTGVSTATASIKQRPITIAITAIRKTYGGIDPGFTTEVLSGSIVDGDMATGTLQREIGESVGDYQIDKGSFSYGSNYAETFIPASLTIEPLVVTVTGMAKTKTYGDSDPEFTYTSLPAVGTVLPNKEIVGFGGQLVRANGETVQGSPYQIKQGTLSNSNYLIRYTEAELTIEPAIITVKVDDKSKEYGAALPELTGSITGAKDFDGITVSFNTDATEISGVVPSGYPITATLTDPLNKLSNYTVRYLPGILMIKKINPVIIVNGFEGVYDGNEHGAVNTSAKGWNNSDLSPLLHLEATTYTNAPGGILHWNFEGNDNYNSLSGETSVIIGKADAVIKVQGYELVYDGDSHIATAKALGIESSAVDLTALFDLSSTVHTAAGDYESDEWSFAGNENYNAAKGTVHNTISKAGSNATVTANNATYDGNPHPAIASVSGGGGLAHTLTVSYLGLGQTIYGPSNLPPVNAGQYSATASYQGDANHDGSSDNKEFTIEKANANITVNPYTLTYDGLEHTAGVTALGVETNPVDLTGLIDVTHTRHTNAGEYTDDYWSFAGSSNYNAIAKTIVEDRIAKANSVTVVTVNGGPFIYEGTAITPATVSVTGVGGLHLAPSAIYGNNTNAGTATASYVFAGDDNHMGSDDRKTFVIDKKKLVMTAENKSKIYDGQTFVDGGGSYSVKITGFAGAETLENSGVVGTAAYTGPATTAVGFGQHVITPTLGTLEASNYDFVFVNGILDISKRSLDISGSKVYDGNTGFPAAALVSTNVVGSDVVNLEGTVTVSNKVVGNYTSFSTSSLTCSNINYNLSAGSISVDITQRPLVVTAEGIDKVYDGNTIAEVNLNSDKVAGDQVDLSYSEASFNDPGIGRRDITVNGVGIGGRDAPNYTLALTACQASANIIRANTSSVLKVSASVVRYMDQLTLTATITPANTGSELTGTVQFKIGSVLFGSPVAVVPIPKDPAGAVQATFIGQVTNLPIASYTVEAMFTSTNLNYSNSFDTKPLQVNQRNADPYNVNLGFYTGDVFVWTTGTNSSTGTIKLSTTVQDNNVLKGDVRAARVTFYLINGPSMTPIPGATNLPVGLVDINDGTVGTASAIVQLNIGANNAQDFKVAVGIGGAYYNIASIASAQAIVTVSKPVPGGYMVCGGKTENRNSSGYLKGDLGYMTDFEADIVYTKSGTNPKGKSDVLIRSHYKTDGTLDFKQHMYVITTNAIASLNVAGSPATATFSSKANLYEQMSDMSMVLVEGGTIFEMVVTQKGCEQQAAITLYRKAGGVWFSSNWNGTKTILQNLYLGQASVYGGGTCSKAVSSNTVVRQEASEDTHDLAPCLAVYPNPTTAQFNVKLESSNGIDAINILMYSTNGRVIEQKRNLSAGQTIQLGALYRPGVYMLEIIQGDKRRQLKLIKIPN